MKPKGRSGFVIVSVDGVKGHDHVPQNPRGELFQRLTRILMLENLNPVKAESIDVIWEES
jgi:hypothetical protein